MYHGESSLQDHDLVDATASTLHDFASNILRIASLVPGCSEEIHLSYEKVDGEESEIHFHVLRDPYRRYSFNDEIVGSLDQAIMAYSYACSSLLKEVAVDEASADAHAEALALLQEEPEQNNSCTLEEAIAQLPKSEQLDLLDDSFYLGNECSIAHCESEIESSSDTSDEEEITEIFPKNI